MAAVLKAGLALVGDDVPVDAPPRVLTDLLRARPVAMGRGDEPKARSVVGGKDTGFWVEENRALWRAGQPSGPNDKSRPLA